MSKQLRSITLLILFLALSAVLFQLDRQSVLATPPGQGSPLPPPPINDNFNRAKVIPTVPFVESLNITYATRQLREPQASCTGGAPLGQTVWYKFTPKTTSVFMIRAAAESTFVAVYTGNTLTSLYEQDCFTGYIYSAPVVLTKGITYYFQAGGMFNYSSYLYFGLDPAPPPQAYIGYNMYQPTIFDTINFWGSVYDPAGQGVDQWSWDFGDNTNSTAPYPQHRYAADGDYTVQLTAVMTDGRTAATSQLVAVRTHDVAITKLARPQRATVGQTRKIVVSVGNSHYPEYVQIQLYKSVPNGYSYVGYLRQYVDVKPNDKPTDFYLGYTFTQEDALVGKVIFKAVATIENYRDAIPMDNEFISFAVKVTGGNSANAADAVNGAAVDDMSDYATDEESNVEATLASKEGEESLSEASFKSFLPLVYK